jgi:ferredoxin
VSSTPLTAGRATLVADCAGDRPLAATRAALARARAEDVLVGLGLLAASEERGAWRYTLVARARAAEAAALGAAAERHEARVTVEEVGPVWPTPRAAGERLVSAVDLVRLADRARGRAARAYLTVAGAVARPTVMAAAPDDEVAALVAAAGPLVDDWVAIAGGPPGGRLVERSARAAECDELLLIVSTGHAVARRLRVPLADWLVRAASACEGCRMCTDGCPEGDAVVDGEALAPHRLALDVAQGREPAGGAALVAAACTGCGLCDAACPSSLAPSRIVGAVAERVRAAGVEPAATRAVPLPRGIDLALLTLRLGLGDLAGAAVDVRL